MILPHKIVIQQSHITMNEIKEIVLFAEPNTITWEWETTTLKNFNIVMRFTREEDMTWFRLRFGI